MSACIAETGADKVVLVGHSAGGWLARAALADGQWEDGVASEDVVAGELCCRVPLWPRPVVLFCCCCRFRDLWFCFVVVAVF